ncbi:MAG TPA: hypothetical protein VGR35_08090 [Tepidisphaeraceae bacterium]|nr:hypothetical protein [Tepidisphaeraceae bacterium]
MASIGDIFTAIFTAIVDGSILWWNVFHGFILWLIDPTTWIQMAAAILGKLMVSTAGFLPQEVAQKATEIGTFLQSDAIRSLLSALLWMVDPFIDSAIMMKVGAIYMLTWVAVMMVKIATYLYGRIYGGSGS